ncbi:MAG: hypothetical protein ACI4UK_06770 [Floccifex sp.]
MTKKLNIFLISMIGLLTGILLSIPFQYPTNAILILSTMILFGYGAIFYYMRK